MSAARIHKVDLPS